MHVCVHCCLLVCCGDLQEEMQHRFAVSQIKNPIVAYTWDRMALLQDFSFVLAVIINLLILVGYGVKVSTESMGDTRSVFAVGVC